MLQKARERVEKERLDHVEGLCLMDGAHAGFADNSFDVVIAQFVITVVPQPEETLDEMARVLKPGGEIILVNHLGAEDGPRAAFEKWFARRAAQARLAPGIPVRPPAQLGGAERHRRPAGSPRMSASACTPWSASAERSEAEVAGAVEGVKLAG